MSEPVQGMECKRSREDSLASKLDAVREGRYELDDVGAGEWQSGGGEHEVRDREAVEYWVSRS